MQTHFHPLIFWPAGITGHDLQSLKLWMNAAQCCVLLYEVYVVDLDSISEISWHRFMCVHSFAKL
jgi:hypothetical protein